MLGAVRAAYPAARPISRGWINASSWSAGSSSGTPSKYDQRLSPRWAPVLAAADEVVRSCWAQPYAVLGEPPPPRAARLRGAPLRRLRYAAGVRAGRSARSGRRRSGALRRTSCRSRRSACWGGPRFESWWLGLIGSRGGAPRTARTGPGGGHARPAGRRPAGFAREIFADAWSVLMIGEGPPGWWPSSAAPSRPSVVIPAFCTAVAHARPSAPGARAGQTRGVLRGRRLAFGAARARSPAGQARRSARRPAAAGGGLRG